MRLIPLTDETDRQAQQCMQHGVRLDDDISDDEYELGFGSDPFDIVAAIEADRGAPLALN